MTTFKILGVEEAKALISNVDDYLLKMKPIERSLKLNTIDFISLEAFTSHLSTCVLEPTENDYEKLNITIDRLHRLIEKYNLQDPPVINIIKTDGRDEWNSAYTRGNSIFLPSKKLDSYSEESLVELLVHEYFHVISRHNEALRKQLYQLLGFHEIESSLVPATILDNTLVNPDAMIMTATKLSAAMKDQLAVPLITMKCGSVDSSKDIVESIRIEVFLLDEKKLMRIDEVDEVSERLKINVSSIQHPEETLAENFTHLVVGASSVENTELLNQMSAVLENNI